MLNKTSSTNNKAFLIALLYVFIECNNISKLQDRSKGEYSDSLKVQYLHLLIQ